MKLKLTYLLLAILALAVGATVWVQFEHAKRTRQREAVQAAVDAAAQKLNIRSENLYLNADARRRLYQVRSWAYQDRRSRDPARRYDQDAPLPPELDPEPPYDDNSPPRDWTQQPLPQPAPSNDELDSLVADDGAAEIAQAVDACKTVQDWYQKPGDEVGAYLRKHPEIAGTRIPPLLLRLLDGEDRNLKGAACNALFAMGDRSPRLQKELQELYAAGKETSNYGEMFNTSGSDPTDWEVLLKQFPRWVASTQPSQSRPKVATFAGPSGPSDPLLPPGVMYMLGEQRFRHGRNIDSLAFSPDGTSLITAGDGLICLWDVATGKLRDHVALPDRDVIQAAFLPDGRVLLLSGDISLDWGGLLRTWKIGGKELEPVGPNGRRYDSFQISPDGKKLAAIEYADPDMRLFELPSLKPGPVVMLASTSPDVRLAFTPDFKTLACYHDNHQRLLVYDVATGRQIHDWPVESDWPKDSTQPAGPPPGRKGLAVDSQNRAILMGEKETVVLDLATGKKDRQAASGAFDKGGFSDGRFIAADAAGGGMDIFLADSHKKAGKIPGQFSETLISPDTTSGYGALCLSPDATLLACVREHRAVLWNLKEVREHLPSALPPCHEPAILDGDDQKLYVSAFDDSDRFRYGPPQNIRRLHVWDIAGRKPLPSPLKRKQADLLIAASVAGNRLATVTAGVPPNAAEKNLVTLYDLEGKVLFDLPLPADLVQFSSFPSPGQLAFSPAGDQLAWLSGGPDRKLCLWNAQDGTIIYSFDAPGNPQYTYAQGEVSIEARSLAFDSEDFLLGHNGVSRGFYRGAIRTFNPLVPADYLAPGQNRLATAHGNTISIWRVGPGPPSIQILRQFNTDLAIAPAPCPMDWLSESVLMIYGGQVRPSESEKYSSCLELWDADSCKLLGVLGGIHSQVISFFHGNGMLFTSHADGAIFAWDLPAIETWCADRKKDLAPVPPSANH